ncbi:dihydroorotase [Caballeronia sp. SEWSISQ10-4 2]|uniref:dihydroorotase n=1 Tax=Caballeronia sp. SEWSISQ10-4 2 TaxID=2937438 RepID=UPI002655DADD|nr:dihydroorotase [Caballeronia sp. SEWSISQ10-4 2]MDN7178046.1 dihydroorotase [Caballeronia sp. SEWSISQ10-4 2]
MSASTLASISSASSLDSVTLARPDDWHLHVRDGAVLAAVLPHTARQFGRAIIMPNLRPPVTTTEMAAAYRERILAALPKDGPAARFEPLMTLYLTDNTPPDEIRRARESGFVHGVKLYPAGATTNSDAGVTSIAKCAKTLEAMQEHDLPLLVHGEVTDPAIDMFDREKVFIDRVMTPLRRDFPALKVVFEHITTKDAADYVRDADGPTGATLTAHHLLYNRNALFVGGIRPHYYCLPVLKRETHRVSLVAAATSGNPRFFLGTDSAPHAKGLKEHACGCAGCYTALHALELYTQAFDQAGALDRLEGFASFHGADFYGLPRATERVTLRREPWTLPAEFMAGEDEIVPLGGGESIGWRME